MNPTSLLVRGGVTAVVGGGLVAAAETANLLQIGIVFVISVAIYLVLAGPPLHWAIPRNSHIFPGIVLSFVSGLIFSTGLATVLASSDAAVFGAGAIGSAAAVFIAVKVATPFQVSMVINTDRVSNLNRLEVGSNRVDSYFELDNGQIKPNADGDAVLKQDFAAVTEVVDQNLEGRIFDAVGGQRKDGPNVWPEHFQVTEGGSLSWHLRGPAGTKVVVVFDRGFDPFSPDGGPPSLFSGSIGSDGKGIIVASPTVRPGAGDYSIVACLPSGLGAGAACRLVIVGGGRVPAKDA